MFEPEVLAVTSERAAEVRHWSEDPRLQEFDADGTQLTPVVGTREYASIGSWEEERAQLIGVVRYLVLEVRDLFERVAEHEDDHFHGRR
jgi:hypothetical protein